MAKTVLTRELIADCAFQRIDAYGLEAFSVRQVAAALGVQVSSLYNHIRNEYDLLTEVAKRAAGMYADSIAEAVKDLPLEEATHKAGDAFRAFIHSHSALYDLLLDRRRLSDPEFDTAIERFTQPIRLFLRAYGITDSADMDHFYIAMRAVTHGFSFLDALGVFDGLGVDPAQCYHMLIQCVIDKMKEAGGKEQ